MADYLKPVVFEVGGEIFGVDINLVQSIEKQVNVVPVPNSMTYINGIINLRGEVVPVYSLKKKFDIKDENKSENTIIISVGDVKIALEVDEVMEISEIDPDKIRKMPVLAKTSDSMYLDRVAQIDNKLVILLDVERLLSESEEQSVKKLTESMQTA